MVFLQENRHLLTLKIVIGHLAFEGHQPLSWKIWLFIVKNRCLWSNPLFILESLLSQLLSLWFWKRFGSLRGSSWSSASPTRPWEYLIMRDFQSLWSLFREKGITFGRLESHEICSGYAHLCLRSSESEIESFGHIDKFSRV